MGHTGRNDPCPCGSGRKYKRCCLERDRAIDSDPFRRVLDTDPRDPAGLSALGLMALDSGRIDSAAAFLVKAIAGDPGEAAYHCNLGLVYRAAGRPDDAEACFRKSLSLEPDYVPAVSNLGILCAEQGRLDEAIGQFRIAVFNAPDSAEMHDNLGGALLLNEEPLSALDSFRKAYALKPTFALAYSNAGNALCALGKPAEAIELYEKALKLAPDNPHFHFNIAKALCDFGKVEEAADGYRMALSLEPKFAEAHNGLGLMLMELGRKDEAIASLQAALRLKPDFAEALFNLHSAMLDARDPAPSIECLRRIVAIRPGDARARVHLYALLDHAGDVDGAAAELSAVGPWTAELSAIVESWRQVRASTSSLPALAGISHDAFRIGLNLARADGLVLEFGVRFGVSIRQIAALCGAQVHGFDSFEGLPEAWGTEARGSYSTQGAMPRVPGDVKLHRGWFADSLPTFLRSHPGPVRFMNVDCDIYSSTRHVLKLLADRIVRGTVIAFDEYLGYEGWREHEFRAFQEAVIEYGWRYEYLCIGLSTGQAVVRIL